MFRIVMKDETSLAEFRELRLQHRNLAAREGEAGDDPGDETAALFAPGALASRALPAPIAA